MLTPRDQRQLGIRLHQGLTWYRIVNTVIGLLLLAALPPVLILLLGRH